MLSVISGVVIFGAGGAGLWAALPVNGKPKPFATALVLEWLVPISIVSALAIGTALFVSGVVS
jgi:succinate dehydrogenase/fumarate reductase flavoprotein subunit